MGQKRPFQQSCPNFDRGLVLEIVAGVPAPVPAKIAAAISDTRPQTCINILSDALKLQTLGARVVCYSGASSAHILTQGRFQGQHEEQKRKDGHIRIKRIIHDFNSTNNMRKLTGCGKACYLLTPSFTFHHIRRSL